MELSNATRAFAALAQETRLRILRMLVREGPQGVFAGALAEAMDAAPSTISFHLKELEREGLIHAGREGRQIRYTADYAGIRSLVDFLLAECCQGDPRLCGPYIIKEKVHETPAHSS
jgi:DNA-binding transcriptional ArsR family regulator